MGRRPYRPPVIGYPEKIITEIPGVKSDKKSDPII